MEILYYAYIIIGFCWAIYAYGKTEDDPRYKGYLLELTLVVTFFLWPLCLAALIYAKVKKAVSV